jgi:hydroxyacylglutathione hydrolase
VGEEGREEEVITRLARVGYDYCIGYLKGGFEAWKNEGREIDQIPTLTADQMSNLLATDPTVDVLDVRKASEFVSEHLIGAENIPVDAINDKLETIDKNKTYLVHCAGGYRSMIFNSILKARGYNNLIDVIGGFKAIKEVGTLPITDFVCPTTLV